MSKNTVVRGCLVPSLKNKPLDGRQDVPTLADIANIENPYVNFIFPVAETGMWYRVLSLKDKVIDELTIPNGEVDEYETFGEGMTDKQKEEYLTKQLAELTYLKKEEAEKEYLKKEDAEEVYQPKGDYVTNEEAQEAYQPKGEYATTEQLEDLENRISQGGGGGGEGGSFIDAPSDGKTYGRKNGLWEELKDAPSDGKAYARMNNTWIPIETSSALDPKLPVLSLNINSTLENDNTISKVLAIVTYADKEFALGNGGQMNVPYGLDVTVTFPNVEYYETPETIVFEDVASDLNAVGTYTYLKELLTISVSTDDGTLADSQLVTVDYVERLPNGFYIEDVDGKLWTKEEWDGSSRFSSIVCVMEDKAFGIYPKPVEGLYFDSSTEVSSNNLSSKFTAKTEEEALLDYNGDVNTESLYPYLFHFLKDTFCYVNRAFRFKSGKAAYVPSLAQAMAFFSNENFSEFKDIARIAGFTILNKSCFSSTWGQLGLNNNKMWIVKNGIPELSGDGYIGAPFNFRFHFCNIDETQCVKTIKTESYRVGSEPIIVNTVAGEKLIVSVDNKEDYSLPFSKLVTIKNGGNNISFVYEKLTIDTIYINNMIADTSVIITGETYGKAVQAIWGGIKRYLGKVVTREDGKNEIVLHEVDQTDNRYYQDGIMVDLESLGTNAYYFTKIPAMAYKITQMSDNIYKVQISYKHNPGKGWLFYKDFISTTFITRNYKEDFTYNPLENTVDGIEPITINDISNLILLMFSKYQVLNYANTDNVIDLGSFPSGKNIENGFSLPYGVNDAIYKYQNSVGSNLTVRNFLGFESLIYPREVGNYLRGRTPVANDILLFAGGKSVVFFDNNNILYESDINLDATYSAARVKSLLINKFFTFIPKEMSTNSDEYYNISYTVIDLGTKDNYCAYMNGFALQGNSSKTTDTYRAKFTGEYRIEQDRDAFNALTNIWV